MVRDPLSRERPPAGFYADAGCLAIAVSRTGQGPAAADQIAAKSGMASHIIVWSNAGCLIAERWRFRNNQIYIYGRDCKIITI